MHDFCLAKVSQIEAYFLSKIAEREKLAKKVKRLATITNASDIGLITIAVVITFFSFLTFNSGCALLEWVALPDVIILLPLETTAS